MRLFFSYQKQYIPNNTNMNNSVNILNIQTQNMNTINSVNTINPAIKTTSLGSIFERIKNTGKCNSCNGVR